MPALVALVRDDRHTGVVPSVQQAVVAGGGDVQGRAGQHQGQPPQPALEVGEGLRVEAVSSVCAVVVRPVRGAGASAGADQGAIGQHHLLAAGGQPGQDPVQAGRAGGEQGQDFQGPAADRGRRHLVGGGEVGQALVVTQPSQGQDRLPAGDGLAQREPMVWRCCRTRPVTRSRAVRETGRALW